MNYRETMRAQVESAPRFRIVCERDWWVGPDVFAIGVVWKRNFDAMPGEYIYLRRFIVRWRLRFRLWLERS